MKTKNNVQKAVLRSVAVVVSFVLISLTVSGQDFWKKLLVNSSFNEIALAMVENSNKATDTKPVTPTFNSALFATEAEPTLEIEDWMLNNDCFGVPELRIPEASEAGLEVEEWMLNDNLFAIEEAGEEATQLEAWMVSEKVWDI